MRFIMSLLTKKSKCYKDKILDPSMISTVVDQMRTEGKTIATLNGSFDLLHAGHLHIIYQASLQADCLIMGLNTDRSIQEYKSPKRPIVPLKYRLEMIAALEFVDYVTFFDETHPKEFIKKVHPDVHVNGADWGPNCLEAPLVKELNARLHIVNLIDSLSTSQIVEKIQKLCD